LQELRKAVAEPDGRNENQASGRRRKNARLSARVFKWIP